MRVINVIRVLEALFYRTGMRKVRILEQKNPGVFPARDTSFAKFGCPRAVALTWRKKQNLGSGREGNSRRCSFVEPSDFVDIE